MNRLFTFTRDNMVILSLCTGILAMFFFLWVLPTYKAKKDLAREIPAVVQQIREIKEIKALGENLDNTLQQLKAITLPASATGVAEIDSPKAIIEVLRETAGQHDLAVVEVVPNINFDSDGSFNTINVDAKFSGDIDACRTFLYSLLSLDSIEDVRMIRLESAAVGVVLSLDFVVRIS